MHTPPVKILFTKAVELEETLSRYITETTKKKLLRKSVVYISYGVRRGLINDILGHGWHYVSWGLFYPLKISHLP